MKRALCLLAVAFLALPAAVMAQDITLLVRADAPGNDHNDPNGEHVKLWNAITSPIAIGGWRLCDAANHCYRFPESAVLAAQDSVRLFSGSGADTTRTFYWGSSQAIWNNDGDVATLTDVNGNLKASVSYGTSLPSPRGQPTPPPPRRACCRICTTGKACGDSCISRSYTCRRGPGCACNGGELFAVVAWSAFEIPDALQLFNPPHPGGVEDCEALPSFFFGGWGTGLD